MLMIILSIYMYTQNNLDSMCMRSCANVTYVLIGSSEGFPVDLAALQAQYLVVALSSFGSCAQAV